MKPIIFKVWCYKLIMVYVKKIVRANSDPNKRRIGWINLPKYCKGMTVKIDNFNYKAELKKYPSYHCIVKLHPSYAGREVFIEIKECFYENIIKNALSDMVRMRKKNENITADIQRA